ncbi:MAG TPA: hypothetical protein VF952_02460 [Chloroflexia bacterium]|jgi:hypothetical protein
MDNTNNFDIEQVNIDELGQEWLSSEEIELIKRIQDTDTTTVLQGQESEETRSDIAVKTLYFNTGQQYVCLSISRRGVRYKAKGSISRRRIVAITITIAPILIASIDQLLHLSGALLQIVTGH